MERDAGAGTDALLAGAERSEILGGFGDNGGVELDEDPALEFASDADIEVAAWVG